jgi:hypothetical protein
VYHLIFPGVTQIHARVRIGLDARRAGNKACAMLPQRPKPKPWFSSLDILIVGGGLAIVLGIEAMKPREAPADNSASPAMTAPVLFDSPATQTRLLETVTLSPIQQAAFDESMTGANFFAVFAIGGPDGFGWAREFSSLADARTAALALCPDACRVIFEVVPQNHLDDDDNRTLTYSQSTGYAEVAAKSGPRAFARSRNGYWGWGSSEIPANAEDRALEECRVRWKRANGLPEAECEIIARWR